MEVFKKEKVFELCCSFSRRMEVMNKSEGQVCPGVMFDHCLLFIIDVSQLKVFYS